MKPNVEKLCSYFFVSIICTLLCSISHVYLYSLFCLSEAASNNLSLYIPPSPLLPSTQAISQRKYFFSHYSLSLSSISTSLSSYVYISLYLFFSPPVHLLSHIHKLIFVPDTHIFFSVVSTTFLSS